MLLAGEEEIRREIRKRLAPEFDVAAEVYFSAFNCLKGGRSFCFDGDRTRLVFFTGIGLLTKATKQFRAISEVVGAGFNDPAIGLSRMLFETMLAVAFTLREEVVLTENGVPLPRIGGKDLTAEFRCQMYLARQGFEALKAMNAISGSPAIAHLHNEEQREYARRTVDESKAALGMEWSDRVRKKGIAGVSVRDLSHSLSMSHVYDTFYRVACANVHANDALGHLRLMESGDLEVKIMSSPDGVAGTLQFACFAMMKCVQILNDRFEIGLNLDELNRKVKEMRTVFPLT